MATGDTALLNAPLPERVKKVEVDPEEPYWSVNIKRGLLSMLQLNLNKERGTIDIDIEDVPRHSRGIYDNELLNRDITLDNIYRIMEVYGFILIMNERHIIIFIK